MVVGFAVYAELEENHVYTRVRACEKIDPVGIGSVSDFFIPVFAGMTVSVLDWKRNVA